MNDTAVTGPLAGDEPSEETGGSRRWVVPALIAGLVIALSLAVTFFVLWLLAADQLSADPSANDIDRFLESQKDEVAERSTEVVKLLFTYDSTNLDSVSEQILDLSTGNFAVEYERLIVGRGLGPALEQARASSRGIILEGPEVSFIGASEAQVIFNVRQTVQNKDNPVGVSIVYVTRLTLVNTEGGGWKADRIDLLSYEEV